MNGYKADLDRKEFRAKSVSVAGEKTLSKRRVAVVITARPSYARIKTALVALQARPDVELQIVACASALVTRFGRVVDLIRADGFTVAAEVASVVEEDSLANSATSTGLLLTQLSGILASLKPDVVVTIADRHETLATAIAASYQHIPLCHIQGGEVSGSIDDKVRNAVTQLADIHCVATEHAADRVASMFRFGDACIRVTGCPSIDLAAEAVELGPLEGPPGIVVVQHPVTNEVERSWEEMEVTLRALSAVRHGAIYFWPGEDAGASAMSKVLRMAGVTVVRNFPPVHFLRLLLGSLCLVGNSSVGIRECSYLGVPVVNIGTRQEGREHAENVTCVPHWAPDIENAVRRVAGKRYPSSTLYGDGHAGERIAAILAGKAQEAVA